MKLHVINHLYKYITENQENSRVSSFEEGLLDVAHMGAQESILHEGDTPTSEAHLKLIDPKKNLSKLSISIEDRPRTPNILDS